jgi:hypothetical protein
MKKQPIVVFGCRREFIELPRYDLFFSRMLAYSQDFARLVKDERQEGELRIRLRQHEGERE